ncbi:MAG: hypothetical protein WA790_02045 [Sulfitobacter sp.]
MRVGLLALLWMFCAAPLAAQSWTADLSDDGGYAGAFVSYPGLGFGFNCAARSIQNKPIMDTMWFETTVAPPYQYQLAMSDQLIPTDPWERSDIILFVDQTGYRLPKVQWNEMEGGWQVDLTMTDASIQSLQRAARVVLQVGNQSAWEIPVNGLGPALEEARQFCAATWIATGYPAPQGFGQITAPAPVAPALAHPVQPGVFQLPSQIQAYADKQCQGFATIQSSALQAGDLDGDGQPDVTVNWRDVSCAGQSFNTFCGAANCSIDVFMSSRGYVNPVQMLGTSVGIGAHRTGRLALGIGGTFGLCGENGCDTPWLWTGSDFEQIP